MKTLSSLTIFKIETDSTKQKKKKRRKKQKQKTRTQKKPKHYTAYCLISNIKDSFKRKGFTKKTHLTS